MRREGGRSTLLRNFGKWEYRERKAKKSSNREKTGNKTIPSPMCP